MIRIFTDSTTDIPQSVVEQYGIVVLPLYVVIEGREYLDRVEIGTKDVYAYMRQNIVPKTAQVNYVDTRAALREHLEAGEDIIYIGFSAKMSGTYQLVAGIMSELREEYPLRRIEALDSRGGSLATGIITMRAAEAAAGGTAFDRLTARIHSMIANIEHVFVITDLNWMIRGGRISKTLGYTTNLLGLKPVLDVDDGEMEVIHIVRGTKRAMQKVADIVAERAREYPNQAIGITHADDVGAAESMKALIKARLPDCSFVTEMIGAVLGVHIGIGGVGVFFLRKDC